MKWSSFEYRATRACRKRPRMRSRSRPRGSGGLESAIRGQPISVASLLHASVCGGRCGGSGHQPQALQQKDGALRGATPDQLAAIALAILNVDVTATVFQTAILKDAINEDALVQNHV